jgi:hypothetical protein
MLAAGWSPAPEALAQIAKELAPNASVESSLRGGAAASKSAPLDLSASKAELGYTPRFPLSSSVHKFGNVFI